MASPAPAATQATGAVKLELYDGHYDCFSCLESVRPDLKEAKAGGNDGNGAVLKCTACTAPPFHAQCVGIQHRTKCGTCRQLTVQPWSPWAQAVPVIGAIAVPDDGPDADQDQTEGDQNVPLSSVTAASRGSHTAGKTTKFLPFPEALLCARSLRLKNMREWRVWCKSDARLGNVPACPEAVYMHGGWQGWGHWLGTGTVASKDHQFLQFKEALQRARSLKLKSQEEWRLCCTHAPSS